MPVQNKSLYVAESLEKLQEKANLDKKAISKHSTDQLCNSAKMLLDQANKKFKDHDEEMAFVYFFKFLDLVIYLKNKRTDFQKNTSSKFLSQSAEHAMATASTLKKSLSRRYEIFSASNERKINEENENDTLHVSKKTEVEVKPSQIESAKKMPANLIIDTTAEHSITVLQLYSLMFQNSSSSFLILDCRLKEEFDESHIKHASCVNVPQEILVPGMTCAHLEQQLPPSTAIKWVEKNNVDYVIILDWDTADTCLPTNHPLHTLEEAMVKWDIKNPLSKQPLILIGGYKEWSLRYPMWTTKALDVLNMEKPKLSSTAADVSGVDYPDLDAALNNEIGAATVNCNLNRFSGSPSLKGKVVNGWVNEPMHPDRAMKPQPLVNRLIKPNIPSSNTSFVASPSLDISEKKFDGLNKRDPSSSSQNQVPEFNRNLKPAWDGKIATISEALKKEKTAAKETLDNTQEQLNNERDLAQLRLRKELEAEESKRIELQKLEELLLDNIRMLQKQNQEHEKRYLALKEENLAMKKHLEAHSAEEQKEESVEIQKIKKMETEKEVLMKQVERLRQERKLKEQKEAEKGKSNHSLQSQQENIKPGVKNVKEVKHQHDNQHTVPLKDLPDSPTRGLTRSYSSPNIAQMVAEQDYESKKIIPTIDRTLKPKFDCRPSYDEPSSFKLRNLNPTYGSIPGRPATGLRNLGNSCYMNSIIQCLSNTEQLANYFIYDKYKQHIRRNNKHGTNGEIVDEFAFIMKGLWAGQYKAFSPKDFKNTASKYIPMCVGYEQQDSHEFLVVLMDKLHADLNQGCSNDSLPNLDNFSVSQATEKFWHHHRMKNRSKISEIFEGLLRSTLTCLSCEKTSNSYEAFTCLSLPILSTPCSLKDSIDLFLKPEKMCGEGAWECPRCRQKKDAEKTLVFSKLPDVLVIQLKRFSYEGLWRRKIQALVRFPFSVEMNAESGPKVAYTLYGIVNHFGYLEGGHYTAYCKNSSSGKWYKYDDHEVSEISQSEIVTSAAYLLFYASQEVHK